MNTTWTRELQARAARIRILLCDVDGVLTDGGLYYSGDEGFAVRFDVKDGLGLVLARKAGLITGIISARQHPEAHRRARDLGLSEVHLNVEDKRSVLDEILTRHRLAAEECCYVGDDLVDLPVMAAVGLPIAVCDAVAAVRHAARWITTQPGGRGAVREVVEHLLAARQGESP